MSASGASECIYVQYRSISYPPKSCKLVAPPIGFHSNFFFFLRYPHIVSQISVILCIYDIIVIPLLLVFGNRMLTYVCCGCMYSEFMHGKYFSSLTQSYASSPDLPPSPLPTHSIPHPLHVWSWWWGSFSVFRSTHEGVI